MQNPDLFFFFFFFKKQSTLLHFGWFFCSPLPWLCIFLPSWVSSLLARYICLRVKNILKNTALQEWFDLLSIQRRRSDDKVQDIRYTINFLCKYMAGMDKIDIKRENGFLYLRFNVWSRGYNYHYNTKDMFTNRKSVFFSNKTFKSMFIIENENEFLDEKIK